MALCLFSSQARAEWNTLKTPHFTCFYPQGYQWEAEQTLNNLEYYRQDVVNLTGNKRIGNLPVVIEDNGMLTNGFADPIFKNMHIFTYPSDSLTTLGISENWYRQVAVHEYTHIAHLTRTEGIPLLLTTINGSIYQPNLSFTTYKKDEDKSVGLWWDYPLRYKIADPLSVWVGLGGKEKLGTKKTRELDVSTQFSLNFPKTRMGIYTAAENSSQEKAQMKKINWQTLETEMQITRYINNSQVKLKLWGKYQPDAPEKEELMIRGYENVDDKNPLKGNKLALVSAEYTQPVLSINGGLWNPNIFLYDLCLSVFTEAGFAEGQKTKASYGIELWQEFGGFLGYIRGAMAIIGVKGTMKEEKDMTTYLSIKFPGNRQAGDERGTGKRHGGVSIFR